MKTSDAFPSKFLRAADLGGKEPTVTIDHVALETLNDEQKLVVYFQGKDAGLVLNKTNCRAIEELAGSDETDDWTGVAIKLIAMKVDFQGKRVLAIRIEAPPKVKKDKPAPPPEPEPEIEDDDLDSVPF